MPSFIVTPIIRPVIFSLLALVCLVYLLALLSALLGFKTAYVTSGSMTPAIQIRDGAILKPADTQQIEVGDIVTFASPMSPFLVAHRVVEIRIMEGRRYFVTRGDANPLPDPGLVPSEAVRGRLVWIVPKGGYFLIFAASLWGGIVLIGAPLFALLLGEAAGMFGDYRPARRSHRSVISSIHTLLELEHPPSTNSQDMGVLGPSVGSLNSKGL